MNDRLLRIYLNDHLAGSTGAVELVARCARRNEGTPLAAFMERLLGELEEDRAMLRGLVARIGGTENVVKQAGAWLVEKVERLKPDGSPFAYSDLDRVIELEALLLGVRGRLALLCVLEAIHDPGGPFGDLDFPALKQRAERQLDELERHRTEAAGGRLRPRPRRPLSSTSSSATAPKPPAAPSSPTKARPTGAREGRRGGVGPGLTRTFARSPVSAKNRCLWPI